MASARAVVTMTICILLMSFLLAVAASADGEISGDAMETLANNRTKMTTPLLKIGRQHAPVVDRYDIVKSSTATETYGTPLEVITSRHHGSKAKQNRKTTIAKHSSSNKVHKQNKSLLARSGHFQKLGSAGSKKMKSKNSLLIIRRALEKMMDEEHVQTSPETEKSITPLKMTKSLRHIFMEETNKEPDILKTPESKKEHKHLTRPTKTGRIGKMISPVKNNTSAKPSHETPVHVTEQGFVFEEKKLKRGNSRIVGFEERPLCIPHDSTVSTERYYPEQQVKSQRIIDSYQKKKSERQSMLTFLGIIKSSPSIKKQKQPKQRRILKTEATHLQGSFSGPLTKGNISEGNWAPNRFILKKAHKTVLNRIQRCAECTKNSDIGIFTVGSSGTKNNAKEVVTNAAGKQCVGYLCDNTTGNNSNHQSVEDMISAPAKARVKKSIVDITNQEDLTVEWNDFNDVKITNENETNGFRHCISTQTFGLGLICMSVILSICFLLLWRKTDQHENMHPLAYIIACIVYVILALVYLGSSAQYYQTVPEKEFTTPLEVVA